MSSIEKTIRKSEMSAQDSYDLGRIVFPREEFLDCSYKEEKEEVTFTYDTKEYRKFDEVKKERRDMILINLIDCGRLIEVCKKYKVRLTPENIYFNEHNQTFILYRDVYGKGEGFDLTQFLNEYRALIGFALQNKYTYEDYYDGGMDLLQKDKFLAKLKDYEAVEELTAYLQEEYKRISMEYQTTKVLINKNKYKKNRILLGVTSGLVVILLAFTAYHLFWQKPYQDAVIEANEKYLRIKYDGVIDAFENLSVKRLSVCDKYMLAYSYIQSENLTDEQKKNIINALSLDTNEKILDYWIYLGRLDVEEAEDIAQQISDNDLLLYAYLKDKNMVEEDTTTKGADKESRLEQLNDKISKLSGSDGTTNSVGADSTGSTNKATASPAPSSSPSATSIPNVLDDKKN